MSAAPHIVTTPLWEDVIPGGTHWSGVLRRGVTLRLVALADDANVAALFYSRDQPLERYNMADTLKAQHTAHLTPAACVTRTWAASSARWSPTPAAGMTRCADSPMP